MTTISLLHRYNQVLADIADAAKAAKRAPEAVTCLAVSKRASVAEIDAVAALGQVDFAENRVQVALPKIQALKSRSLIWHFIGPIQSNKTSEIATHFTWVHSTCREKIALRLNEARAQANLPPMQVCVQLKWHADTDPDREGVDFDSCLAFCEIIHALPHLQCRGLMIMPPAGSSVAEQKIIFHAVCEQQQKLKDQGIPVDTLSMGMSDDFTVAIQEGSTMVRIGTAIFG